jgi:hypothetical protein
MSGFALALVALLHARPTQADGGGATRCEAVFSGPVEGCSLGVTLATTGSGPNATRARKAAGKRLHFLVALESARRAALTVGTLAEGTAAAEQKGCPARALESARFICTADPALDTARICYADLKVDACWRAGPIDVEDVGWRAMERGRSLICAEVDAALAAAHAPEATRATCARRCLEEATVRCP